VEAEPPITIMEKGERGGRGLIKAEPGAGADSPAALR